VSEDEASLAWLNDFLSPWFQRFRDDVLGDDAPGPDGADGDDTGCEACDDAIDDSASDREVVVHHVADAARYASLRREAHEHATVPRPCFALDTELLALPSWERDGRTHLIDEENGCALGVSARQIALVADPRSQTARLVLMRVVRELLCEAWGRPRGRLQLHAAAFAVEGEALAIVGPKRAGKTTLLLHALQAAGAQLIGNDRIGVRLVAGGAVACGLPSIVSIRPGTLARFPRLLAGAPAAPHPSQLNDAEWSEARLRFGPAPAGDGLRLSPARFCAQLGIRPRAGARLGALLLCRIDASVPVRRIEALSENEARAQVLACLYGAGIDRTRPTVLAQHLPLARPPRTPPAEAGATPADGGAMLADGGEAPADDCATPADDGATSEELVAALVASVPVFACRLGPRAHEAAADLRGELTPCAR